MAAVFLRGVHWTQCDHYVIFRRCNHYGLKISEGGVFTILHESLEMRKLFSKWVPRLLTPNQKQQRDEDSERCFRAVQAK